MHRIVLALALIGLASHVALADEDRLYACHEATPGTKTIMASFAPDVSLRDLVTWVAGFSCKTVVVDAEVHARVPKVSIVAPQPMTPNQAMQLFIDAVQATGMTVIRRKDTIIIKLGPRMTKGCPAVVPAPAPAPTEGKVTTTSTSPQDAELDSAIAAGIRRIDDSHYEITRAAVTAILDNPMAVAKGARVVPAVSNGKPLGFKLYAIRPASLYARIGLQNGDTLLKINGFAMTTAEQALEVYAKLREAKQLVFDLMRAGKPATLVVTIKE